ncbi:MAG: metalloregulator ArsR/SmtB family transcription factor [Chloroflexi bacterium]|nr:metalloregulator ArsR/SmtB family transcription factor [Chloroflexota bacterium]
MKELRSSFRALADVSRLKILNELSGHDEMQVSDLARLIKISQPLISWHLRKLKRAGLIRTRRVGRQVMCSLNKAELRQCAALLTKMVGSDN